MINYRTIERNSIISTAVCEAIFNVNFVEQGSPHNLCSSYLIFGTAYLCTFRKFCGMPKNFKLNLFWPWVGVPLRERSLVSTKVQIKGTLLLNIFSESTVIKLIFNCHNNVILNANFEWNIIIL